MRECIISVVTEGGKLGVGPPSAGRVAGAGRGRSAPRSVARSRWTVQGASLVLLDNQYSDIFYTITDNPKEVKDCKIAPCTTTNTLLSDISRIQSRTMPGHPLGGIVHQLGCRACTRGSACTKGRAGTTFQFCTSDGFIGVWCKHYLRCHPSGLIDLHEPLG